MYTTHMCYNAITRKKRGDQKQLYMPLASI